MHLPRHTVSSEVFVPAFVSATFSYDSSTHGQKGRRQASGGDSRSTNDNGLGKGGSHQQIGHETQKGRDVFACATRSGFLVAQTNPLNVVSKKDFSATHGGLLIAAPIESSSLLVLVGGGQVPRYAPNKVILWDDNAPVRISPVSKARSSFSSDSDSGSPNEMAATSPSTAASTVFDAGSTLSSSRGTLAEENIEPTSYSTSSLAESQLIGSIADEDEDDSFDARQRPLPDSVTSTTADLPSPFEDDPRAPGAGSIRSDAGQDDARVQAISASEAETSRGTQSNVVNPPNAPAARRRTRAKSDGPIATGREVMELEFDEEVRSICVRCFSIPLDTQGDARSPSSFKMALLVVVLKTKAVLFELGEHIPTSLHEEDPTFSRHDRSWGIVHRMVFDVLNDGRGLVDLVGLPGKRSALLALSGRQSGHVLLVLLSLLSPKQGSSTSSGVLSSSIIAAHSAPLASLTLSRCGNLLATASTRGTLVRVWSTTGQTAPNVAATASRNSTRSRVVVRATLQTELRRGTEQALVLAMSFSPDRAVLAAASDKGTIHFFNLQDVLPESGPLAATTPSQSPPVQGFSLSASAARYLPSGLNQLASQIPSSMLPQYLKSQWSVAQFRIKLRTFAAYSSEERATKTGSGSVGRHSSSAGDASPSWATSDVPAGRAGVSRSTEGAWATLKGRIEDIRRWEPGLDERIFLGWIEVEAEGETTDSRLPAVKSKGKAAVSAADQPKGRPSYQLIALTTSGGWYRISLQPHLQGSESSSTSSTSAGGPGGDTVLDMYRSESRSRRSSTSSAGGGGGSASREGTTLEEFRVFGGKEDWSSGMVL